MELIINNLPILICAVVGIALLIFEMFMPGFGIPGISGIALLIVSVVFTWMEHGMLAGLGAALVVIVAGGLAVYLSLRSASRGRLSRSPLILKGAQTRDEGFVAQDELTGFVGRTGTTATVLRPAGIADFDGIRLNVVSQGAFIAKGEKVVIRQVEGARVLVEKAGKE